MLRIRGIWQKIILPESMYGSLQRSSHNLLATLSGTFIFGGEFHPRQPIVENTHQALAPTDPSWMLSQLKTGSTPSPRVGAASAKLGNNTYLFSGRGGAAMTPICENGTLHVFSHSSCSWSQLRPTNRDGSIPPARSYHCLASDNNDTIFLHAGCPEKGRLSDLWAFRLSTCSWEQLAAAPGPPRGGTSIAFAEGRLWRMNGFDGRSELGGQLDAYDPVSDRWQTRTYLPDGKAGPTPRSVSTLFGVRIDGRPSLVTLFGEGDPSSLGHQGAGKMLADVWVYDIEGDEWNQVETSVSSSTDSEGDEISVRGPCPRGWFAADVKGENTIVVHGGLDESNNRLGDLWLLKLGD